MVEVDELLRAEVERLLPVGGDDRLLRRVVAVDEVGVQRIDLDLERIGVGLRPIERVALIFHSLAPLGFFLLALSGIRADLFRCRSLVCVSGWFLGRRLI